MFYDELHLLQVNPWADGAFLMSSKKVPLGGKPTASKPSAGPDVDAWVGSRQKEPNKRLTIDIPASLHARMKADCAMRGRKMADEVRDLLLEKYGKS